MRHAFMTFLRFPLAFALLLALIPAAGAAEVIVVFDGSGSAAGRIGGTPKIDIARSALAAALTEAPEDLSLGFIAYGHRRKEACEDIELLAAPATGMVEGVLAASRKIRPRGQTPIAGAIALAAGALTDPQAKATVVVITDDGENCDPDPCATVAAVKEHAPGLRVSIVGLNVSEENAPKLACFADQTGGLYLRAADADGFTAALAEALADAWKPEPEAPLPEATLTVPDGVTQGTPFAVGYSGPLGEGDQIRISWAGTPPGAHLSAAFVAKDGAPVHLTAPAERGRYEVRYWYAEAGKTLTAAPLQVNATQPGLDAPAEVAAGQEFTVAWTAVAVGGETLELAAAGGAAPKIIPLVRNVPTVMLTAPGTAGTYELRLRSAPPEAAVLATRAITVTPAQVKLQAEGTVVAGSPFTVTWSGPAGRYDDLRVAVPGSADGDYVTAVRLPQPAAPVTLDAPFPAGSYELRYWSGADNSVLHRQPLTVGAATATLDAPDTAAGGTELAVAWTGPAAPGDRIVIAAAATPDADFVSSTRLPFDAAPAAIGVPSEAGAYEIRYLAAQGAAVIARRPLTVTAARAALAANGPVDPGAGVSVIWQGPAAPLDEIRLSLADRAEMPLAATRVGTASPVTLTAPAQPGRYVLSYWSGALGTVLATAPIEVRSPAPAPPPPAEPAPEAAPVEPLEAPPPAVQ